VHFAAGAGVMVDEAVAVADWPALLVTLQLSVTLPLSPGVNAMLSVLSPTMMVPFAIVQA
jgi:hypothetical protein